MIAMYETGIKHARLDRNWWLGYTCIKAVFEEIRGGGTSYHSFSSWVKEFTKTLGITKSYIWNTKKAGEIYERYSREASSPLPPSSIDPGCLVLLEQLLNVNPALSEEVAPAVLSGEMKRVELNAVYKANLAPREKKHSPSIIKLYA